MSSANMRHRTAARQPGGGDGDAASSESAAHGITARKDPSPTKAAVRQQAKLHLGVWGRMTLIVGVFTVLSLMIKKEQQQQQQQHQHQAELPQLRDEHEPQPRVDAAPTTKARTRAAGEEINSDKCDFRSYPSNRLYGLSATEQPQFLSEAAYIRGEWPIIINPAENDGDESQQTPPVKVCLDTTSWEDLKDKDGRERLPFTDGHNPSVVSLSPNPYESKNGNHHMRLDPRHLEPLASAFPSASLDSLYMSVAIFGGGQCKFGFSKEEVDQYRFSLHEEPPGGKRAVIAVLAPPDDGGSAGEQSPFRTIAQTTLLLEKDAKYGTSRKRAIQPEKSGSGFARIHQEFDDPRLFFHLGRVWVLYRNGPLFGYNDQVHNPVHFEKVSGDASGSDKFVAYVKASETVWVGGGRNIALISEEPLGKGKNGDVEWAQNPSLKALTWVDPVTVRDDIDLRGVDAKLMQSRRLSESTGAVDSQSPLPISYAPQHRRLGAKPNKSNIHGTNGYMVPLVSTGELMGIAHFHRPEHRKESEYALHGHHYTHALFTIARQADGDARPFKLSRISNEFAFRANSIPAGETHPPEDVDIIQFASGLDVVGSDTDGQLIISYGINDCEGAVFTLSMQKVQQMLIQVRPGQEVVDLMEAVKR